MNFVGWYLRHGIPWMPLLGCCAGAALMALLVERWPSTALLVLPAMLATCAAAAAFSFDEPSLPVIEVTPRGGRWRSTARLGVAGVPLVVWFLLVALRPGDLDVSLGAWWLVGLATISLSVGLAALASRRAAATPGGSLAPVVVLAVLSPVVICAFLGWDSLYPTDDFPPSVLAFWSATAGAAGLVCVAALRPTAAPRPRLAARR
jgi:hypothetical protein